MKMFGKNSALCETEDTEIMDPVNAYFIISGASKNF